MAKPRDSHEMPPDDRDWWQQQDSDQRWQEHCQELQEQKNGYDEVRGQREQIPEGK